MRSDRICAIRPIDPRILIRDTANEWIAPVAAARGPDDINPFPLACELLFNFRHRRPRVPGERLGRIRTVLQRVAIAARRAAARAVHPANLMAPNRWRSARLPAPLRIGAASWRPSHIQVHGVDLRFFELPRPPRKAR